MIISWEQIRQVIELFSEEHFMIKRFYSDYEDQLSTYSTLGEDFPVLYMTPVDGVMGYTQNMLSIRFYCFDRIIRDRTNWNGVVSDTHRCLNDLYKFLQSPNVELIDTELEASILPINDATMDYVAGWYMDVDISLDTYSDCFIMIDGVPTFDWYNKIDFIKYLTCDDLEECDTFTDAIDNLQEQIDNLPVDTNTYTTGATLSGEIIEFNRNDGVTYSVDLGPVIDPIQTDITDLQNELPNYLPLSGGTMSGEIVTAIERWTFDFMDKLDITIYADDNFIIDEIDNIVDTPTITIEVNDVSYTLGDAIALGDKIKITSDIASVVKMKIIK